uniref:Retrovirus-related Pol polyprotein from transposon TNT 1-94 n=1 Tax=Tanacetum cinerariifolium TaxID=118510 RepID=A0A6L2MW33_TANCI|nr:retrovirus-related Pol polyprotein from transposon TNT 1-94 [Tanacetum cinerariifolium]
MQIEDYLYQKKFYEPLVKAKPTGKKAKDWTLLDRQALGVVKLSLSKNIAYNVVNENTAYDLFKDLFNMLMSVDIKFDDELQALLLFSSSPESWPGTVTAVSGSTGTTKIKFDNIRVLILGEEIRRKTSREYSNSLLSAEDKGRAESKIESRSRIECPKPVASKDMEVHMEIRDYDDTLECCVENTIDDCIMDSGASFYATYCKEELELFKLRSSKVRLADDKTLDIVGVRDVLDEEGYRVGFRDQQWKVAKASLLADRRNKRGSLYIVEVPFDGINATTDGRGDTTLWNQRLGYMSEKGMKILASEGRILDLQKAAVGFCEPCVLGKQKKADLATMLPLLMTTTGREYSIREFIEYCAENRIRM